MIVDEESFLLYAGKHYDMRRVVLPDEFTEDLKRFQYLKRLFKRYKENDDLRSRLILNHLVVLYNCFGLHATVMLFFKLDEYHDCLKPFLAYLGYLPKKVWVKGELIYTIDIPNDETIITELREI